MKNSDKESDRVYVYNNIACELVELNKAVGSAWISILIFVKVIASPDVLYRDVAIPIFSGGLLRRFAPRNDS